MACRAWRPLLVVVVRVLACRVRVRVTVTVTVRVRVSSTRTRLHVRGAHMPCVVQRGIEWPIKGAPHCPLPGCTLPGEMFLWGNMRQHLKGLGRGAGVLCRGARHHAIHICTFPDINPPKCVKPVDPQSEVDLDGMWLFVLLAFHHDGLPVLVHLDELRPETPIINKMGVNLLL